MAHAGSCPKCQGSMEQGFLVDIGHGYRHVSTWVEGAPRDSLWSGIAIS